MGVCLLVEPEHQYHISFIYLTSKALLAELSLNRLRALALRQIECTNMWDKISYYVKLTSPLSTLAHKKQLSSIYNNVRYLPFFKLAGFAIKRAFINAPIFSRKDSSVKLACRQHCNRIRMMKSYKIAFLLKWTFVF